MEWTNEAPSEPGWYWWRLDEECGVVIPLQCPPYSSPGRGEWWPVRLQEPEEPTAKESPHGDA